LYNIGSTIVQHVHQRLERTRCRHQLFAIVRSLDNYV
jgi:hypothetical protein